MKKYITCLAVILLAGNSIASAPDTLWTRTYGGTDGDQGNSVQETSDSGFIIAGWTASFGAGNGDVYLIRTNSSGDTLWTRTYGGIYNDCGYSVQQTSDGGFIIAGVTSSFGAGQGDVWLIKTDSLGDTLWTRTYGGTDGDWGWSVQETSDSGFIIVGGTASFGASSWDVYLIRINSSGDTLWTKTFGRTSGDYGNSVQQTSDGGFIIAGMTDSVSAGVWYDVYLIRTDPLGDTLWTKTYGKTNHDDWGGSVQQTLDGGFIIAGGTHSFGAGGNDVYLIRTNSSGDTLWTRTYGGTSHEDGSSVQQTTDGGFIIAGGTHSFGAGGKDVYLIKTDSLGDTLWTKTFGGTDNEEGYSVQQTSDGGFIIAGITVTGSGDGDVYLIRLGKEDPGGVEESKLVRTDYNLSLHQNPAINFVNISYTLPSQSSISLNAYDITGKLVKKILTQTQPAGSYTLNWDLRDANNKSFPVGIYFLTLNAGDFKSTKKVTVIR